MEIRDNEGSKDVNQILAEQKKITELVAADSENKRMNFVGVPVYYDTRHYAAYGYNPMKAKNTKVINGCQLQLIYACDATNLSTEIFNKEFENSIEIAKIGGDKDCKSRVAEMPVLQINGQLMNVSTFNDGFKNLKGCASTELKLSDNLKLTRPYIYNEKTYHTPKPYDVSIVPDALKCSQRNQSLHQMLHSEHQLYTMQNSDNTKYTVYAFSAEVGPDGKIRPDTIGPSTIHPDYVPSTLFQKSFAYQCAQRDMRYLVTKDAASLEIEKFKKLVANEFREVGIPEKTAEKQSEAVSKEAYEQKETDKTADKSSKTEFGMPDCWDEPTPTEAREAKRQANLEEKVLHNDDFGVKDKKNRDIIVSKIAESVTGDKKSYTVTMELRQDGQFGADDPYVDSNLVKHDHNGKTYNTVRISESQFKAIEAAAGDNIVQDGKATRMAVSGHLMNCKNRDGDSIGLMLNTKTVQPPSVEFNEKTLTDHRDTISRNRKDVEKIQSLTKDADKIKSTLNARFASAAQVGSEVSQPESSTPDYPF